MKSFIEGKLKFENFKTINDVPQTDREAYTGTQIQKNIFFLNNC